MDTIILKVSFEVSNYPRKVLRFYSNFYFFLLFGTQKSGVFLWISLLRKISHLLRGLKKYAIFSLLVHCIEWVFQENKASPIFRKNRIFLTLWYAHVLGGKKCSFFRKIWRALISWSTRFEIHPFSLLPTISYFSKGQCGKMQLGILFQC